MSKETDKIRMVGVLPSEGADPIPVGKIPDGGTQVAKYNSANENTVVIHTVDTGKTLYLVTATISANAVAAGYGYMLVRNASDVVQYYIFQPRALINTGLLGSASFPIPLEIPAGYDICIYSDTTNYHVSGFIFGYEA